MDLNRRFDENVYDLNVILHPGLVFDHPRDVLADTTLSRAQKAGDPGILGFQCRRGDFTPEPADNTGDQRCRADR